MGETKAKIRGLLLDLLAQECEIVTIGQYLQPTQSHYPVSRFVEPDEFKEWEEEALKLGFKAVASGPFVRSSFKAEELYEQAVKNDQMTQDLTKSDQIRNDQLLTDWIPACAGTTSFYNA